MIFKNETYNIKQVMNTTGLCNVDVDLQGTLSWDNSDLPYWLNHSLPVGYQNQSSVSSSSKVVEVADLTKRSGLALWGREC